MSDFERYERPVIEATKALHSIAIGTLEGMGIVATRDLAAWLEWRLTDGWEPTRSRFDELVRMLGHQALVEWKAVAW